MTRENGELIVYRRDGVVRAQLRTGGGTVWLSQRGIADLYATTVTNVNHIIRRILDDGEVTEATIDSESTVRSEGSRMVRREVNVFNLDMILAVGYRVGTRQAVLFRQYGIDEVPIEHQRAAPVEKPGERAAEAGKTSLVDVRR
ncbi:MAG: virulence RhuM family protein, partial [Bifidobacteriaceae bacterium]|nr:virulence RhuM family protein [Bifidobacteriaceae bacterium]